MSLPVRLRSGTPRRLRAGSIVDALTLTDSENTVIADSHWPEVRVQRMSISRIVNVAFAAAVLSVAPAVVVLADHHEQAEKKQDAKPATTRSVQPVDFSKLKDVLPPELAGLKRATIDGERTAVAEFKLSQARATYGDQNKVDAASLTVELADYGAMPDFQGLAFWAGQDIVQETEEGYTRTIKIRDQPALEQYTNDGKSGSLQVVIAKRYFLTINSTNLSADDFKKIAEQLPVQKLLDLKE
jgi:hypothetical protein